MIQLEVRPEFRDKIPPLSADEYSRLEANILEDGEVREPIVVWRNIIIDGHHRWAIIQKHPELQDKFKIKQMEFPDKWAAIVWMCRNQLGRRNLTDGQKTYLIGKQCEAQSQTIPNPEGINQYSEVGCQNDAQPKGPGKTAEIISRMNGVPKRTVQRAVQFSKGLDAAEKVSPGIKDAVLAGEVKAPKSVIARIRNIPEEQRPAAVEAIKRGEPLPQDQEKKSKSTNPEGYSQEMREENKLISDVVSELYDEDRVVTHTVDHLLEDLEALTKDFIGKVNRSLEIFGETLGEAGAIEKVDAALEAFEGEVEKIRRGMQ